MPQIKRHKRLKRIASKQKFGVRYLHQHLFNDDPTSDEDSVHDIDPTPTKPDGRFCFIRCVSGVMILAGIVFALVGGLVSRREIVYRVKKNGEEEPVSDDAIQYNSVLDSFVLVGGVLMMLGGIMLAAVQILLCYPRRQLGTKKPRVKDPENFLYPEKKSESETAAKKFDKVPVFALVHKVQPQKKEACNTKKSDALKKQKLKTSFDDEQND